MQLKDKLDTMKVDDLKEFCKQNEIKGFSGLPHDEIVKLILEKIFDEGVLKSSFTQLTTAAKSILGIIAQERETKIELDTLRNIIVNLFSGKRMKRAWIVLGFSPFFAVEIDKNEKEIGAIPDDIKPIAKSWIQEYTEKHPLTEIQPESEEAEPDVEEAIKTEPQKELKQTKVESIPVPQRINNALEQFRGMVRISLSELDPTSKMRWVLTLFQSEITTCLEIPQLVGDNKERQQESAAKSLMNEIIRFYNLPGEIKTRPEAITELGKQYEADFVYYGPDGIKVAIEIKNVSSVQDLVILNAQIGAYRGHYPFVLAIVYDTRKENRSKEGITQTDISNKQMQDIFIVYRSS